MSYIPLEHYPKAWIFRHKDLPIPEQDLAQIKPLSESRSEQLWAAHISRLSTHHEHFSPDEWPLKASTWLAKESWQGEWDSPNPSLPEAMAEHLKDWDENITVYFCYQSDHLIETTWGVFKRHWKNFLFFDNGPILIGKKRKQVIQFFENGQYQIGTKP